MYGRLNHASQGLDSGDASLRSPFETGFPKKLFSVSLELHDKANYSSICEKHTIHVFADDRESALSKCRMMFAQNMHLILDNSRLNKKCFLSHNNHPEFEEYCEEQYKLLQPEEIEQIEDENRKIENNHLKSMIKYIIPIVTCIYYDRNLKNKISNINIRLFNFMEEWLNNFINNNVVSLILNSDENFNILEIIENGIFSERTGHEE